MSKVLHLPEEGTPVDGFHFSEESGLYLPNQPIVPPKDYVPPKIEAPAVQSVPYSCFCPSVNVFFEKLTPEARTPTRGTDGSYGSDLYACIGYDYVLNKPCGKTIKKGWAREIDIGIKIAPPWGCGFVFVARSNQEIKHRLRLLGGVIDWDFGGRISIFLANEGDSDYTVLHHDRVAQVLIFPVYLGNWVECAQGTLPTYPTRGEGGIGSTGR